jgi:hypothetical protein
MAMTIAGDALPRDSAERKFAGPVDPTTETFCLPMAVQKQTLAGKDYAAAATLSGWNTAQTHDALSVGTTPVKRGLAGSSTAGVDGRGCNAATAFVTVSGLAEGEVVVLRLWRRYTQTGSDFEPAVSIGEVGNGNAAIAFDVDCPYFMVEAQASAGTAAVTVNLFLYRK